MASVGTASLDIIADKQQLGRSITGAVDGNKGVFGGLGKKIGGLLFGGAAAFAGVKIFKDSIDEAREAAKVQKLTNAVIASTKGAANIAASGVGDLANRLSLLSGIDDETIQSGENVLLTFTNIKNAAGVGNDIFNQATGAALDMSRALGTDLQGSVIQVGKALNDPIKGVTALQRVGVSFTSKQKEQIKTLVDSGKTLEAQKLILGELKNEFGGAAAAAADPMQKLGVVWKNLEEQLGGLVLPLINKAAVFLGNNLPGAITRAQKILGPFVDKVKLGFSAFKAAFSGEGVTSDGFVGQMERIGVAARDFYLKGVKPAAEWLQNNWPTALKIAGAAFLFFTGPITFVVIALALLYIKFQGVRDFIGTAIAFIVEQFGKFRTFAQEVFPQVQEAIGHFISVIGMAWRLWGDDILKVVKAIWSQVQLVITTAVGIVQNVIRLVLAVINGDWGKAWDAIKGIFSGALGLIIGTAKNLLGVLSGLFGGALDAARRVVSTGLEKVVGFFEGLGGKISRATSGMFDGIKNAFKSAINWVIKKWNGLDFKLPSVDTHIPGVGKIGGFTLGTPDIPTLHSGGVFHTRIPGGEGLALLRDGERVSTPEQDTAAAASGPTYLVLPDGRVLGEVVSQEMQQRWDEAS